MYFTVEVCTSITLRHKHNPIQFKQNVPIVFKQICSTIKFCKNNIVSKYKILTYIFQTYAIWNNNTDDYVENYIQTKIYYKKLL